MAGSVVIVGAFPPPVGGAAKNNENLRKELTENGVSVSPLDISAATLSHTRSLGFHAQRVHKNFLASLNVLRKGGAYSSFYIVPDGGLGAWYSLVHILAANISKYRRVIIHHRTFLYIDKKSRPVSTFTSATRNRAVHVFLSKEMAVKFQNLYGPVTYIVAGNARYVSREAGLEVAKRSPGPLRIGYLSNICAEKGYHTVSHTFRALSKDLEDVELWLAGPILEQAAHDDIEALKSEFPDSIRYFGPLYGDQKSQFYRDLDLFIFPTEFPQEAAPNVVYEALASGTPVLSTERGCIREMLYGPRGQTFPDSGAFISGAPSWIIKNISGLLDKRARQAIKGSIAAECQEAEDQHKSLIELLSG